ncbi:MAG: hypothetical protein JXA82_02540 [Sedimentisphaerales bacterium]|nr:hypothetical protein [Sedimentisphaerales bacterium]
MKRGLIVLFLVIFSFYQMVFADQPVEVTHWQFQAVHTDGTSSFDDNGPWQVILEGILLNNPEQWLDPTPDPTVSPWFMGGEWEIVIQGEGDDHAGTFCWMGQNYGNGPGSDSYSNEEWLAEICRLNRDPNTAYIFRAGDRVRVTGTYLFYGGKLNVNENHQTDSMFDFKLELIKPSVGLPQPEEITLADLKHADDTEIFDPARLTGGEYYQSRRVRINRVSIVDPENWAPNTTITVTDGQGRTFPVVLALGEGIARYECPTGTIDVIGIMDQKAPGYPADLTKGYRLLVLDYDGNGLVLGESGSVRGNLPGDINHDFVVNLVDLAELAEHWMISRARLCDCF